MQSMVKLLYMKVRNRNSVQTPSETHLQYPHAPKCVKFIFFQQNTNTGAHSAAVCAEEKGSSLTIAWLNLIPVLSLLSNNSISFNPVQIWWMPTTYKAL